jgi:hypothetical protein
MLKRPWPLNVKFWLWLLAGLIGFLSLLYVVPLWSAQHEHSAKQANSEACSTGKPSSITYNVVSPAVIISPDQSGSAKYSKKNCGNKSKDAFTFWEAKASDLALVFFTYCLVIVGWFTLRSGEVHSKRVERAYLFADFRNCFIGDTDESLEFFFGFHNAGKTPALAYEVYGEIADTLPPTVSYPDPERLLSINRSIGGDKVERLGSVFANTSGPVVFGYVKYRDIFGDSHTTGFAAVLNTERRQWETDATEAKGWNYWTD